jgi:transcriptional regulator with XRE-family HTH domain
MVSAQPAPQQGGSHGGGRQASKEWEMVVGKQLRQARERAELTRTQVAEAAGCHPQYVYQVETGRRDVSLGMLTRLAEACQCRVNLKIESRKKRQG